MLVSTCRRETGESLMCPTAEYKLHSIRVGCTVCQARPFDWSRLVVFHWPPHITLNNKCYFPKCQNYFSGPLSDGTVVVLQTKREPLEDTTTTDVLGDIGLLDKVGCMRSNAKYDWNKQQLNKWEIFFSPIPVRTFVFSYFHQIWGWEGGLITAMDSRSENLIQAALCDSSWGLEVCAESRVCLLLSVCWCPDRGTKWWATHRFDPAAAVCLFLSKCARSPSPVCQRHLIPWWFREWTGCLTGDVQQCPKFLIPDVLSMIAAQCGSTQVISSHV